MNIHEKILVFLALIGLLGLSFMSGSMSGQMMKENEFLLKNQNNFTLAVCSAGVGNIEFRTYTNESWPEYWYVTDNDYYFESAENFDIGDPIEIFYYCNNPKHLTSIHYQY